MRWAGRAVALAVVLTAFLRPSPIRGQDGPPPSTGGFFPLSQVRAGMQGTAWTVFKGSKPEAMDIEILGVLRGARGPGHDMILVQLHGAHAEYTGVVEGMSGSPVYIGNKLLGALAYRIGQFSKDPIAGVTPIEQMLEVRDLPVKDPDREKNKNELAVLPSQGTGTQASEMALSSLARPTPEMTFQTMETPLVMSGFGPEAIRLWQQKMAGTSLEQVAAGGMGASSEDDATGGALLTAAQAGVVPGSAVSAQLVRGDVEISATCTVTYIDPKQLLACGHTVLQAGTVSLPMTTANVVTTLASPLNAFKIINTGATIGAFTEDRDAAIRGVLGTRAHMIPMHVTVDGPQIKRKINVEILDMPALTPQAMEVVLFQSLMQANDASAATSYHLTGNIDIEDHSPTAIDVWSAAGDGLPAPMQAALAAGERFTQLYSNGTRQSSVQAIDLHVEAIPRRLGVELEAARLVSNDTVHAGAKIVLEATIRPWEQPARNVRIPVTLPSRLASGNIRLLVSDAGTLDRTMSPPALPTHHPDLEAVLAQARQQHSGDRIYISLLVPETQAAVSGQTLTSLPLSMANALEPKRSAQEAGLNGESAVVVGDAPAGGVLSGFQVINLHIQAGGGLN